MKPKPSSADGAADDSLPPELDALISKTMAERGLDEVIARRILAVVRTMPAEQHQLAIQKILEEVV